MSHSKSIYAAAAITALAMAIPGGSALAGGGGGGGGGGSFGSAPSSTPSFDPSEVYREGVQQYRAGDYAKAEKSFRRVARVTRTDANTHYMLGLSQIELEKWRKASGSLRKAVRYNEDLHDARAKLGFVYIQQDKLDKANEQMGELETRLAACGDSCPQDLTEAAEALRVALAPDAAAEDLARLGAPRSLQASTDFGDAAYLDAVRLINLSQYDTALDALENAQTVFGPHPDILTYIGFANRKAGNYDQAILHYEAALTVAPDHLAANEYLGEYYVELGDMDAAEAQLAKLDALCTFGCAEADELRSWVVRAKAS
ncbi:MAG: tetratricopeptide repeat protein [Pseudomonadota bacterium]